MKLLPNAPAAVDLDFAPARRRRPGALGWILLAIGLLAAGFAGYDLWMAERDLGEREALVARLRTELRQERPQQAVRNAVPVSAEEREPAERVSSALNADWAAFFTDLEGASHPEVALLEIQGDAARGSLRVVGEAQSVEAAFAWLEQLQRAGMLREARIDSHEWVTQGPQMVVRFVLTAQWRSAS
jgi:hypothetical protein